jgi:hypothetical protein
MRQFRTILFILTIIHFCTLRTVGQSKSDEFNVNHGVMIDRINDTLKKNLQFLKFENSVGIVFPADYGKQKFGQNLSWQNFIFFTPDTTLIKTIETVMTNQYCNALQQFNKDVWERTFGFLKDDNDLKSIRLASKQMRQQNKSFKSRCQEWQFDLKFYDKQYVGYKTPDGENIIFIQLLDFREDPYKLRLLFNSSWIDGWHGWFETNTKRLHYHVDSKLLTIN